MSPQLQERYLRRLRLATLHPAPLLTLVLLFCSACGDGSGNTAPSSDAGSDTAVDTGTVVEDDTTISVDTQTGPVCPGGEGCPCTEANDCDNNLCIDTPAGKRCGTKCIESCPEGFACQIITRGGADGLQVCVPRWGFLCAPCKTDAQCESALGSHASRCIVYSKTQGNYCGSTCDADSDCPADFACESRNTITGEARKACVRKDGICPCSPRAASETLSTVCQATTDLGTCPGTRTCEKAGEIGACSAPPAVAEVCDGVDNNCNGATDDGLCDDKNPCTTDGCVKGGSECTHTPTTGKCDDGSACTEDDACEAKGSCGGKAIVCDDKNPCTQDSCKATTGCVYTPHNKPCSDGNACTANDLCDGKGACVGLSINVSATCNDNNVCTADTCDAKATGTDLDAGCTHTPTAGTCEDGNPCTNGDACTKGACVPGANVCACNKDADCSGKEDGNLCNGTLYCNKTKAPFVCEVDPKTLVTCDTSKDDTCSATVCEAKSGKCGAVAATDGKNCDADNSVCTTNDACLGGVCKAGKSVNCNDKNPCTDDSCDPNKGCKTAYNVASCDDGDACSVGDTCAAGKCISGKLTTCDDGSACTKDACDKKSGKCVFDAAKFEGDGCDADGSVCTTGDTCLKGVCTKGKALPCDDKKVCTTDSCDKKSGCKHLNNSLSCDADGDACTVGDGCKNGVCAVGPTKSCDDKNVCTVDACDSKTGKCTHDSKKLSGTACDADGSKCTVGDACTSGTCTAGKTLNCDDGKFCTTDACNKATGCEQVPNDGKSCDDGDDCTKADVCKGGTCSGKKLVCSDGNPCTVDSCGKGGCKYTNIKNGSGCGGGKYCVGGMCIKPSCGDGFLGQGERCDDGNAAVCDGCESCVPRGNLLLNGKSWAEVAATTPTKGGLLGPLSMDGDLTVEAWVRPDGLVGEQAILTKAHKGQSTTTFALLLSGAQPLFMHSSPFGTEYFPAKDGGKAKLIPAKTWSHLAVVVAGRTVRIFVNGKPAGVAKMFKTRLEAPIAGVAIGKRWWDAAGSPFSGQIDEVHVASAPLYGGPFVPARTARPDQRTVAMWHFDEPGALSAEDAGTHGFDLTLKGAKLVKDTCLGRAVTAAVCGDGKVDAGIESCDQSDTKACDGCEDCRQEKNFNVDAVGAMQTAGFPGWAADAVCKDCTMTVEAWVRPDKTSGTYELVGASCGIFSLMYSQTPSGNFFGLVRFPLPPLFGKTTIKPGAWYHVAAVIGFAKGGPLRLYVNGKLEASASAVLPAELPGWEVSKEVLLIGGGSKGTGQGCVFKQEKPLIANRVPGRVDEVRLSSGPRYGDNFTPRRRLLPDANTRGLWHFDSPGGLTIDDSGQSVATTLLKGAAVPDQCYGDLASTAVCGDGQKARWEGCDNGTANGVYPKKCDVLCAPTVAPDCTSFSHAAPSAPTGKNTAVYSAGAWTVEGWVRLPTLPFGNFGAILAVDEPSSIPGKGCGSMPSSQAWRIAVNGGGIDGSRLGGATEKASPAPLVWRKGVWQHFAMQYHGDTTGSLWLDGRLVRTFSGVKSSWSASCPIRIGDHFDGKAHPLSASIAALRWSKIMRYGEPFIPPTTFEPDTNAVWQFDLNEGSGSLATDLIKGFKLALPGVTWSKKAGPGCG